MAAEMSRWSPSPRAGGSGSGDGTPIRRERREQGILIAEYTPFPRHASGQHPRFGFTRDFSRSGMCLGVDAAERVGDLLRVTIRDLDGRSARTSIERVVWCSAERDGRHWLGLERLTEAATADRARAAAEG